MKCKICNSNSDRYLDSTIFKEKIPISYFKCSNCDFIQTQEPFWLDKAYSTAITKSDIGLISRNIYNSTILEKIVLNLFPNTGICLDYAAGYGMFVRIMRDKGFDFYWQDDYCENIFSTQFIGALDKNYSFITAFEVLEHLPDPMASLGAILSKCDNFCFSTSIIDDIKDFNNWWYRGEVSGQHISFYSKKTLELIAKKHGLHYYSFERDTIHLFTKEKIDNTILKNFLYPKKKSLLDIFLKNTDSVKSRESLLSKDYNNIVNNELT